MPSQIEFTKNEVIVTTELVLPITGLTSHRETIQYNKLPSSGLIMTINSITPKLNESGDLTSIVFQVGSFQLLEPQPKAQNENAPNCFEVRLTKTALKYWLLPLHIENRRYFPGFKENFELEIDGKSVTCWVSGAGSKTLPGDPDAGSYVVKNLGPFFGAHKFQEGDKVSVEIIEIGKKYRLLAKNRR